MRYEGLPFSIIWIKFNFRLLDVSVRGFPSSWRCDDGAALLWFTGRELPSATSSSTTVFPAMIKITEELAPAMPSSVTSTAPPRKGPSRLQRASGHGSFAEMRWLIFFVLPQRSVTLRKRPKFNVSIFILTLAVGSRPLFCCVCGV
ncbi:hypothetical protein HPB47_014397, partial [Ixodes persulcatus]